MPRVDPSYDFHNGVRAAQGVTGFYKGSGALFVRIASWNIVMFVAFERLKGSVGL